MSLNQTDFSALGGVGLGSQSRYEKAETQPAVGYLAALATHGIDIGYLLTGQHSAESLDSETSALVTAIHALRPDQRAALLTFLATFSVPQPATE